MKREKIIRKLEMAQDRLHLSESQREAVATVLTGEERNSCPYTFAHTSGWCGYSACRTR